MTLETINSHPAICWWLSAVSHYCKHLWCHKTTSRPRPRPPNDLHLGSQFAWLSWEHHTDCLHCLRQTCCWVCCDIYNLEHICHRDIPKTWQCDRDDQRTGKHSSSSIYGKANHDVEISKLPNSCPLITDHIHSLASQSGGHHPIPI